MKQQQAQLPKNAKRGQENVSDIFISAPQSKEQEQLRPKCLMGAHMLNDPNHELKEI